ncbi:hypothetical protein HUG10_11595 [Halorarum halophilum]|uniref:Uncharacterized protein n=1 Tax=Halorarum halophilum TaxID=2743090 RepID=A0A7D5GCE8_9EURY|nr:hypothetical protein [Halobaculum halophilum]QLG28152.1 hypothetical protein HUG10_11595 [Halobaculum halophilum]
MSKRKTIHVVVDDEQKERWKTAAEDDPAVNNTSEMVRLAVEQYIAADDEGHSDELLEILDTVTNIEATLAQNNQSLNNLHQDTLDGQDLQNWAEGTLLPLFESYIYREELDDDDTDAFELEFAEVPEDDEDGGE